MRADTLWVDVHQASTPVLGFSLSQRNHILILWLHLHASFPRLTCNLSVQLSIKTSCDSDREGRVTEWPHWDIRVFL